MVFSTYGGCRAQISSLSASYECRQRFEESEAVLPANEIQCEREVVFHCLVKSTH